MSTLLSPDRDFAHFRDEKTANTNGGNFVQGAWRTRTLNTTVSNTIPNASLSSDTITLPAGTYDIHWSAPAFSCNAHLSRLWNVTLSSALVLGQTAFSNTAAIHMSFSAGACRCTFSTVTDIRLEHICTTTRNTDGLGRAANLDSQSEVYAELRIWRVI